MSERTTSAIFTVDELWLLQSVVRHEMAQSEQWKQPPVSLALNDQVAESLLLCHDNGLAEAALLLTRGDCLAIDYCVSQGAKSPSGVAVGKSVLLKSFKARRELEERWATAEEEEPALPTHEELLTQLEQWKRRKRGRRSA
ncbi:MAG: hypothetical protein ACR2HN_01605 [Tepidiformaceae bacterium]